VTCAQAVLELFGHVSIAMLPMSRSCTHLDSLGKFGFQA